VKVGVVHAALTRRTGRTFASRVSTGHLVMVLAGVLGVVLTLSVLRADDDRRSVLVAATHLAPGAVIDADAVRVERIDAGAGVLAALFTPDEVESLDGRVAVASIEEGALVTRDAVKAAGAGAAPRSMSFPLPRARAVGGQLDARDRVDVLAVERDGAGAGYVMADAEVLAVDSDTGGPLGTSDEITVTLAVD
jgi:Flp pilus assembly protein CpaB